MSKAPTKIKLVQSDGGRNTYYVEVATGKRLNWQAVAGNTNFQVVESIQESADRGPITPTKTTPTLEELRKSQIASYLKMGLSLEESRAAAGLEDKFLKGEDPFSILLKSL